VQEIFGEIKNKCDPGTYTHLRNFITVKLNGYRLEKSETGIVKYEMTDSQRWFKYKQGKIPKDIAKVLGRSEHSIYLKLNRLRKEGKIYGGA